MLFGALDRWWADGGNRAKAHEGLDLCLYRGLGGQNCSLGERTKTPLTYDGEIVKIDDDFLGKSVYVCHDIYDRDGNQLYTIYGHTKPDSGVDTGMVSSGGETIATIAEMRKKKAAIPAHLHISMAWIPKSLPRERLTWESIADPGMIKLLNLLDAIAWKYAVLGRKGL